MDLGSLSDKFAIRIVLCLTAKRYLSFDWRCLSIRSVRKLILSSKPAMARYPLAHFGELKTHNPHIILERRVPREDATVDVIVRYSTDVIVRYSTDVIVRYIVQAL